MSQLNPATAASGKLPTLLFWVAMAAQVALAYAVAKPWTTGDSQFYLGLAASIDEGFYGWGSAGAAQPDALRPPGYPAILWLLHYRLHLPIALIVAVQLGLYLASILLIDRRIVSVGLSTAPFRIIAPIYPFGAVYCGFLMTEAWAMLALTALALLVSTDRLTRPRLALAGLIMGLAVLIRSDLILLPLLVGLVVVVRDWRSAPAPAMVGRAMLPALIAAAVLAPYALWNLRHFDRLSPIPVASAVGNSLYLASWQGKVPLDDLNALYGGVAAPRVEQAGLAREIRGINSSFGADPMTPPFNPASYPTPALQMASSEAFGRAARERIQADPGHYIAHVGRNLWALWNSSTYPVGIPPIGRWGLILVSGLVYLGGLLGLIVAIKWRPRIAAAGAILLYPMLVHLPLHTEARYTAAVRPLLLMFASFAALWLLRCYRDWRSEMPATASDRGSV